MIIYICLCLLAVITGVCFYKFYSAVSVSGVVNRYSYLYLSGAAISSAVLLAIAYMETITPQTATQLALILIINLSLGIVVRDQLTYSSFYDDDGEIGESPGEAVVARFYMAWLRLRQAALVALMIIAIINYPSFRAASAAL